MLTEILQYLKNWFELHKFVGTFEIRDGALYGVTITPGQYVRVIGSVFHDGVVAFPIDGDTQNETFTGAVWSLGIPKAVLDLADEIEAWQEKNGATVSSPFTSESFAGYSYSKASGKTGSGFGWADAFESRLAPWRKI